ncbi:ribbon-helix-helix domain-containing protein [Burkholderiaceae bacterium DAT-1]|nr:ribbon-helix-helix domain-containing protein [Burkholderiaceae bacterium DAT-1]
MMRTLVDITEPQLESLNRLAQLRKQPRAQIIREALTAYIESHQIDETGAFGLWKTTAVDGLAYQEQARSEW